MGSVATLSGHPSGEMLCWTESGRNCTSAVAMSPLLQRISVDPNVCFGKPCIRGTRLWVSLILDILAAGATVEEVLAEYPQLRREDVLAAIAYGAEMSRERFVDLPGSSAA